MYFLTRPWAIPQATSAARVGASHGNCPSSGTLRRTRRLSDFPRDSIPEFCTVVGAGEGVSRNCRAEKCAEWSPPVLYLVDKQLSGRNCALHCCVMRGKRFNQASAVKATRKSCLGDYAGDHLEPRLLFRRRLISVRESLIDRCIKTVRPAFRTANS